MFVLPSDGGWEEELPVQFQVTGQEFTQDTDIRSQSC